MRSIIQIAGIRDANEADLLLDEGVEWLGFPLRLPVHKEDISEADAARIIRSLRPPARGVLITYLDKAVAILEFMNALGTKTVQLHGDISAAELARLKSEAPDLYIIKSLVVRDNNLAELEKVIAGCASCVDAFITDTFDPATGASGATGKTHDWEISKRLIARSPLPVILAGGLNPQNVRQAILAVKPAGVDAHTGVEEADGSKSRAKVSRFVAEARTGFDELAKRG